MRQSGPPAQVDEIAKGLTLVQVFVNMACVGHSDVVPFGYYPVGPKHVIRGEYSRDGSNDMKTRELGESNIYLADLYA